ncbi:hypothetical protein [Neokomagataea anthophila]|uniref:DUF4298 domain-containing protein n=1 Tax=Neokomagataea anthophila TaxID=2826925 RepID=A0ABS5E9Y7_9PROT|nr:hypothetical protein [Neokomagataea anthophila]MBR0560714.1 hypothetical protein [Neokomagataea anthophila]
MESLDTTYERMRAFRDALDHFDERLGETYRQLTARHEDARDLWRDRFAVDYAAVWAPWEESLRRWCLEEGPRYREFVTERHLILGRYLEMER